MSLRRSFLTKRYSNFPTSTTYMYNYTILASQPYFSSCACALGRDNDRGSVGEVGGISGGAGEEDPEMAKTPLQHCCCHYPRGLDNALQSVDQEAEFPPACREQQLCQPERYSPACLEQ